MSAQKPTFAGDHSSIRAAITGFRGRLLSFVERSTRKEPRADYLTAKNQRDSPLLRLPAELRNTIYNLVMTDHVITVCGTQRCAICWNDNTSDHTVVHCPQEVIALTATCRQIHADTYLLPYTSNIFCGFAEDLMKMFDASFSQKKLNAITSLCILTRKDMVFSGLRRLLGLQRVTMASHHAHANSRLFSIDDDTLRKIMVRYMIKEINMLRNAEGVEVKVVNSDGLGDMGIDWRDCPSPVRSRDW